MRNPVNGEGGLKELGKNCGLTSDDARRELHAFTDSAIHRAGPVFAARTSLSGKSPQSQSMVPTRNLTIKGSGV